MGGGNEGIHAPVALLQLQDWQIMDKDCWRNGAASPGAMLFIMVVLHTRSYRNFKHFRYYGVQQ